MSEQKKEKALDLASVISTAIRVPGVKVVRDDFLRDQFKDLSQEEIEVIVQNGPVLAGRSREELHKKASRIIKARTAFTTTASFMAGLPGGLAMAATIPADLIQFYGTALRMAQELVYLYGEADLWCDGTPDGDKVTNQLILYCGVMLGASGAAQAVRVMTSALAKQALKKLPRQALTKHFIYNVIKSTLKFFGVSVTKSSFAKGVSKALPVVGGVVSGGITLASMLWIKLTSITQQKTWRRIFKRSIRFVKLSKRKKAKRLKQKRTRHWKRFKKPSRCWMTESLRNPNFLR